MRKLLKYLLLGFCALFLAGNATAAIAAADQVGEDTALQGKIIQSFCNSLGFNVLEEKDSSFMPIVCWIYSNCMNNLIPILNCPEL